MENFNKKEILRELQRSQELMYGKEIINEQLLPALKNVFMDALRTSLDDFIKQGITNLKSLKDVAIRSLPKIAAKMEAALGRNLTKIERTAVFQELRKSAGQAAEDAAKKTSTVVKTVGDDASKVVKTAANDASKVAKTAADDASKVVKTAADDASKKTTALVKYTSDDVSKKLLSKGKNITDNAGNVVSKNGVISDLTPAIVRNEKNIPKLATGLTDDAVKPYFRQYLGAFDDATAKTATGAAKKGSTLVGRMTDFAKKGLIKLGVLKNVGGRLTISWKRVLLYALLFGVGYSVVSNWFKDNGVTPVNDPNEPIVNQDPNLVDPTSSGSQDSGTSGQVNTVVTQSPSGKNRYTFDFATVMAALNATGKCPTGYGTSGSAGTDGTSGLSGTSGIITEPDTTLSSEDYYEYMSS